ncbi:MULTISPECIES: SDR family oxidoreductase [Streptomyces]|nr:MULTISPECIES: SDR family oxidoreductase [Streptomyces]NEE34993.1 SDR family oxidoreductase [Streptomyces sp. SID7982]NEE43116.1 SDR family oxidoreductase [Streptomyces sp. SID8455]QNE79935.1 SDR family NAD(P)-dependent oxidoreductase [Streptomyces rutgersensis]RPK83740.1 putative oxidoreductase [Streptomyces sp. ADI98-12]WSU39111.1 SDR family oxidoreductase [Streptomyces gougerotii]
MDGDRRAGRVAVVTGAARGVGAATARRLAERGLRVALIGRELGTLEKVARSLPTESCSLEVDVTDEAALRGAARSVAERMGPASVVVANAGIAAAGPFATTEAALWDRVIAVNLLGSAATARAFLPQLVRTRGYLLQVASTAAFGSAPLMSAYCASKAGVESYAQALRTELEPEGVQVGIAYLHWTGTGMIEGIEAHPVLRELRAHQPGPGSRVHSAEQVAGWLVRGVERRAAAVYAPRWLRLVQPLRPVLPLVVSHIARRSLARMPARELRRTTGVLGPGGRADWEDREAAGPVVPARPPQS